MAVYKKTYRRYEGPLTQQRQRFLVIPRYAFEEMHASRFLSLFFLGSLLWPVVCALVIYLHHNLSALKVLNLNPDTLLAIDAQFFLSFLGFQSMLAYFLTAFIGPGLISPDLGYNALSLYLARPFSRFEYVGGKFSVLAILLSLITWVPGLLLFGLQSYLVGGGWMRQNLRIAAALFCGAWIWILLISLLALALSAWVKWKPAAGALLFGVFFVAAGFGGAINQVMRTRWGNLLNVSNLVGSVWTTLFQRPMQRGAGAVFFRVARGEEIPIWCCWAMLLGMCGVCVWLLSRKIRGAEVVR